MNDVYDMMQLFFIYIAADKMCHMMKNIIMFGKTEKLKMFVVLEVR